jgi:DNA-binding MarR family transcriptional regulator
MDHIREFRRLLRKFEQQMEVQLVDCCGGISVAQCHALFAIEDTGRTTITILTQEMGLDKSTLSRTIEGLVNLGLVERTPDPDDRRVQHLTLTADGQKTCDENNRLNNEYYSKVFKNITVDEQANIIKYLTMYIKAVDKSQKE